MVFVMVFPLLLFPLLYFPVISFCVIVSVGTFVGYLRCGFPLGAVLHLLGYYGMDLAIRVGGAVSDLAVMG
jgi:hypothetical protein